MTKVTPAPWHVEEFSRGVSITHGPADDASERYSVDDPMERADCEFCALARNAFDVMTRRQIYPRLWPSVAPCWGVWSPTWLPSELTNRHWPDPFTALVEADKWLVTHEAPP